MSISARPLAALILITLVPAVVLARPSMVAPPPRHLGSPPGLTHPQKPQTAAAPAGVGSCSLASEDTILNFGSISALHPGRARVQSIMSVSCVGDVTASILFCDAHAGANGDFALTHGSSVVHFTIGYESDGTSETRLRNCTAPGIRVSGKNASATYRLTGTIAGSGPIRPGDYADTVTASVIY